ncbi:MAG: di-trans,poly-cis-decaprenylcistransferase [Candidatus Peribacteria bacterium]|nr:MAG: di-trans,poly-cis-decaprenylcistransferase [Candidatus Peribacteria bacterium]
MLHHLAIIMDGNRRWAKERMLPKIAGHKAGYDNLQKMTELCKNKGIKYLTVWALSTENLEKRSPDEVGGIIKLLNSAINLKKKFLSEDIQVQVIGDTIRLPESSQKVLEELMASTSHCNSLTLTIALIYGGQDEIIRGIKRYIATGKNIDDLTTENFREYLDVSILPRPDVIVRTGGDVRHSGFLLYDSDYSEYYFTEKKWPEFDEEELDKVIAYFENCKRNF